MAVIDRKFKINAISLKSGKKYTENNAILFLLKDKNLPAMLVKYKELCVQGGADERQILGLDLLMDRVMEWQRANEKKVKLADIEQGKEEKRVCKPNK
jgi:hypothetical protein